MESIWTTDAVVNGIIRLESCYCKETNLISGGCDKLLMSCITSNCRNWVCKYLFNMFTCYKYADHDEYLGYSGVVVKLAVLVK